jgi:protein-tyrosine kinase
MGKISDALERNRREKSIKTEKLFEKRLQKSVLEDPENRLIKETRVLHEFNPKLVVVSTPDSVDAENFKVLRAQILFARDGKIPKTIMVTSCLPGEGKTYVTANLAASIALGIDEHVLVVDCDLRRPHLHEILGYSNSAGLHEYLTGKKGLPELIIRTKIQKLSLLTAGDIPRNPSELLSSSMMEAFLEEVKGRYQDRFIVIDSTPCQVTAETSVLAKYVDGIVLVVMSGKSTKEAIRRSIDTLGKEKILGVVFNGYSHAHRDYQKYYKKYYKGKG